MSENEESATRDVYKAALTPEEWTTTPAGKPFHVCDEYECAQVDPSDHAECHAIAARALAGQPFGFTHADVELLRDLAHGGEHMWINHETDDLMPDPEITSLADRIAALLPPEPAP